MIGDSIFLNQTLQTKFDVCSLVRVNKMLTAEFTTKLGWEVKIKLIREGEFSNVFLDSVIN